MNREQAIEEIRNAIRTKVICNCSDICAEAIYKAGYRLIPELPVLSDEEIIEYAKKQAMFPKDWCQAQLDADKRRIEGGEHA